MPLRKLWNRIRNLPNDSAFGRANLLWTEQEFLTAQLINVTAALAGSDFRILDPAERVAKQKAAAEHRSRMRARFDERQRRSMEGGSG